MLGLEARGHTVRPKVLALHDGRLRVYYLKALDLNCANDITDLVKLVLAFLVSVDYCSHA